MSFERLVSKSAGLLVLSGFNAVPIVREVVSHL